MHRGTVTQAHHKLYLGRRQTAGGRHLRPVFNLKQVPSTSETHKQVGAPLADIPQVLDERPSLPQRLDHGSVVVILFGCSAHARNSFAPHIVAGAKLAKTCSLRNFAN
jgi:hypothetical protein